MQTAQPSFEHLVDAHYAALYRFALSMSHQEANAKDLVQHTFLQWARRGHSLRDPDKVKTWLFTTIRRAWLAMALRERKHVQVEFDPDQHSSLQEDADEPPQVNAVTLQRAMDQLSPPYRAALVLFYLKEQSYHDIAITLRVPVGTVMSRLSRGRNNLRQLLIGFEVREAHHGTHRRVGRVGLPMAFARSVR
jgi:RNA polymerase sigma factor (sigma-70 family)